MNTLEFPGYSQMYSFMFTKKCKDSDENFLFAPFVLLDRDPFYADIWDSLQCNRSIDPLMAKGLCME